MSRAHLIVAEPHAAYLHRPKLVVDASVMAALVYSEANAGEALAWIRGRSVCAPHIVDAEVTNAGMNKIRRRALALKQVAGALELYTSMQIERYSLPPAEVLGIAHRYLLSAYDAAYLWLAASLNAPLATFDLRLGEAAMKHLGGGPAQG